MDDSVFSQEKMCSIDSTTLQERALKTFSNDFTYELPLLNQNIPYTSDPYGNLLDKIREFYFGSSTSFYDHELQYIRMVSDVESVYLIDKAVQVHAAKSTADTFYWR